MRIIVADNIPMQACAVAEGIHTKWPKWDILTACNGLKIVRYVKTSHVDIIISDICMPKMDGFEMLTVVRRISPNTKIILITADPKFEYAQKALRLGAADILLKPVDLPALYDLLAHLTNEKLNDSNLQQKIFQWLEYDWNTLAPDVQNNIREHFPHGCICAISAPANDSFPQPGLLAENIGLTLDCIVQVVNMLCFSKAKLYALVYAEDKRYSSQLYKAIQDAAIRHGFRAGISAWCNDLPAQGHKLWLCAREGTEQAFYRSAAVIHCDSPYIYRIPEFPSTHKLLSWFAAPEGWKRIFEQQIKDIEHSSPDCVELIRNTQHVLQNCGKILLNNSDKASEPPLDYDFNHVTFFSEYCLCLENSLAQLEKQYCQNINHSNPIGTAIDYIRKHYMEPITLADMASLTRLSPNYFSTLFRKQSSICFTEYVLQVRLEKACSMLINTDMFVYEIANACGYENIRYFVRVFKNAYGLSPTNFRKCFGKGKAKRLPSNCVSENRELL
ncbi:MAG: response regulator transcription factor [Christensenellales bacterium]